MSVTATTPANARAALRRLLDAAYPLLDPESVQDARLRLDDFVDRVLDAEEALSASKPIQIPASRLPRMAESTAPAMTAEQRDEARDHGNRVRKAHSALLLEIRALAAQPGGHERAKRTAAAVVCDVIRSGRGDVERIQVERLLIALPRFGSSRAVAMLAACDVRAARLRLVELSPARRELLAQAVHAWAMTPVRDRDRPKASRTPDPHEVDHSTHSEDDKKEANHHER